MFVLLGMSVLWFWHDFSTWNDPFKFDKCVFIGDHVWECRPCRLIMLCEPMGSLYYSNSCSGSGFETEAAWHSCLLFEEPGQRQDCLKHAQRIYKFSSCFPGCTKLFHSVKETKNLRWMISCSSNILSCLCELCGFWFVAKMYN